MFMFSVLLLCSFFRLKESFQVKNGLTTSLLFLFFVENSKNLGRAVDAKRRKNEDGLSSKVEAPLLLLLYALRTGRNTNRLSKWFRLKWDWKIKNSSFGITPTPFPNSPLRYFPLTRRTKDKELQGSIRLFVLRGRDLFLLSSGTETVWGSLGTRTELGCCLVLWCCRLLSRLLPLMYFCSYVCPFVNTAFSRYYSDYW